MPKNVKAGVHLLSWFRNAAWGDAVPVDLFSAPPAVLRRPAETPINSNDSVLHYR